MAKKAILCHDTQSPGCSWQNAMNVNVCRKQRCSLWHVAHRPGARSTHCALQSKSFIFCCEVASDVIQLCTDSISGKVDILQKIRAVQRFVECKVNLTIPILDVHVNWCCEGIWHLTDRPLCTCTQQAEGKDPPWHGHGHGWRHGRYGRSISGPSQRSVAWAKRWGRRWVSLEWVCHFTFEVSRVRIAITWQPVRVTCGRRKGQWWDTFNHETDGNHIRQTATLAHAFRVDHVQDLISSFFRCSFIFTHSHHHAQSPVPFGCLLTTSWCEPSTRRNQTRHISGRYIGLQSWCITFGLQTIQRNIC